jgi:hypothetical protein
MRPKMQGSEPPPGRTTFMRPACSRQSTSQRRCVPTFSASDLVQSLGENLRWTGTVTDDG